MAGGGRTLENTPTWAVACVIFVMIAVSIVIEHVLHLVGKWLKKKHKKALYESFEKIKAELMLLGFISLLLTVATEPITEICISKSVADTWHPCSKKEETEEYNNSGDRRKLLSFTDFDGSFRRILATKVDKCEEKNKVAFISYDGVHQLHIFIFVLALFHVLYCILTLMLGRAKMSQWKAWENESRSAEYQFSHDPERFRFARETSFGRRHLSFWTKNSVLIWIVCFFRQFFFSVPKVDYLTLRHGFIMAHLAPQSQANFDFQKYIKRSLEEDFKVVVGISPLLWFAAVLFILFQTHGTYSYFWLPFIPLVITLLVGAKLQVIITKMGLRIQERSEVVQGVPVVQPGDDLFWFNRPRLILYLINYVLFQNAFQLAYFAWTSYEFGFKSCFHEKTEDIVIRLSVGIMTQILCSYVTFPLYALVTQMGSTMKPTIFNDRVAMALKSWHHTAKKHVKQSHHNNRSSDNTPFTSQPGTPSRNTSPIHLFRNHRSSDETPETSPRGEINVSSFDTRAASGPERWDGVDMYLSPYHHRIELGSMEDPGPSQVAPLPEITCVNTQSTQLPKDFSFGHKRSL